MSTNVRLATLDDAAAICGLNSRELGYRFPPPDSTDALAEAIDSPREIVVVGVSAGEVVGYCHGEVYRLLYAPPMANVLGIAVRRDSQRQGIGAALMAAIEKWAPRAGLPSHPASHRRDPRGCTCLLHADRLHHQQAATQPPKAALVVPDREVGSRAAGLNG